MSSELMIYLDIFYLRIDYGCHIPVTSHPRLNIVENSLLNIKDTGVFII